MPPTTSRHVGLRHLAICAGLALLVVSPPLLEKLGNDYFIFDVWPLYLRPHLASVAAAFVFIVAVAALTRRARAALPWVQAFFIVLLLLFAMRGFFSAAGIAPDHLAQWANRLISAFGLGPYDSATIKRAAIIVVFVVALLLTRVVARNRAAIVRACAAFGFALAFITVGRTANVALFDTKVDAMRNAAAPATSASTPRRVVWIIFDELDYNRAFANRNPKIDLPHLDRLQREGISATRAVPPAPATAMSLPALISGVPVRTVRAAGPANLVLVHPDGSEGPWHATSTLFSRLRDSDRAVSVLGFAHNYCAVFPYVNPCESIPGSAYPTWWWGIWRALATLPGLHEMLSASTLNASDQQAITDVQLARLEQHLDRARPLSFFHFNFPHLPGGRIDKAFPVPPGPPLPGYDANLLLVDQVVGRIVGYLERRGAASDSLLIVSSDHWLRTRMFSRWFSPRLSHLEFGADTSELHTIPLLIRRMRHTTQHVLSKPISTIHTARFVEEFLDGKLADHEQMAQWWLQTPFVPSVGEEPQAGM